MKGIVFTEFLEMVEDKFSTDLADRIIETANPESGGAYTSVGTYDHKELVSMVVALSQETGITVPNLLHNFGRHLFGKFLRSFPSFFEGTADAFELLERVDSHIHIEVRKLYPDAELPKFDTRRIGPNEFEMIYSSSRHFQDLAGGLIDACIDHYSDKISVERVPCEGGFAFTLRKN